MKNIILPVLIVLGIVIAGYFLIIKNQEPVNPDINNQDSLTPGVTDNTNANSTTIMVPLITQNVSSSDFGPFGCGAYIKFEPQQVPQTQAVLGATYNWLFSNPSNVGSYYNEIASQTNLSFDSVQIVSGIAKIYLTGSVMGNHCGDATFAAQIEQAALQYPTVSNVEVYVNGQLFDWCDISDADVQESGCDTNPRLWNSQRIFEN